MGWKRHPTPWHPRFIGWRYHHRPMRFGAIRIHYLLLFALSGAYLPYLPVYLNGLGLGDAQIGWVMGVHGVMTGLMPLLFTHWADRRVSNRVLLGVCNTLAALALAGMCTVKAAGGVFGVLLLINLAYAAAATPMSSLLGGLTFAAIHEAEEAGERPPSFTQLRLWGSVGYTLPGIGLFFWMRYTGADAWAAMLTATVLTAVAAFVSFMLPDTRKVEVTAELPGVKAWKAVCKPPLRVAMVAIVLLLTAMWVFYGFFTRFLQELGLDPQWYGLIINLGVFVEIGCMLASNWFMNVLGLRRVMILGAVCTAVRFALLAATPTVAVAVLQQVLHGPVVMSLYVVAPMYFNQKATADHRNSMQGLLVVIGFGLTRLIGATAGGYIVTAGGADAMTGMRWAFAFAAGLSVVAAVYLVARFRDPQAERALKRPEAAEIPEPPADS